MAHGTLQTYETIYVLKPNVSDADASVVHQKIDAVIAKFEGKLNLRDELGTRELAYEIDNERSGKYTVIVYTGKSGVVEEIERHFKISGLVLRYLTVAVESDYEYATVKKQIQTAEEEIQKAREARKRNQEQRMGAGGY